MPDPRLLDPVSLFLTDERSDAAVVGSGNKAMGKSPFLRSLQDLGLYKNNKELMTEDSLRRLHLKLGKKAMEKLMKPVAPRGYLEPFVLLEPPAHNPGCSCVLGLTDSSGTFV